MNQIINTNRAVRVKFDAYTSTNKWNQSSSADIYVPFQVSWRLRHHGAQAAGLSRSMGGGVWSPGSWALECLGPDPT